MNIKDLKPLGSFAVRNGAKILAYGPPGGGKTPSMPTAPNPVCLLIEKGAMSVRNVQNVPAWQADNAKQIEEFFDWVARSPEAKQFDTMCVDSVSAMAEMFLANAKTQHTHGLKQYGQMADDVRKCIDILYYTWPKNVYAICQMDTLTIDGGGTNKRPGFPGQNLSQYVPHLFDVILYADEMQVPGVPNRTNAFRCKKTFGIEARDRSGKLAEYEPQNLTHVIQKLLT